MVDEMLEDSVHHAPDVPRALGARNSSAVDWGGSGVTAARPVDIEGEPPTGSAAIRWTKKYALNVYRSFSATPNWRLLIHLRSELFHVDEIVFQLHTWVLRDDGSLPTM